MSPLRPKPGTNDAREIANTNTTSTLFLGNRTKSWMLASSAAGPSPRVLQNPSKRVKSSRLRLNTHSATNSVSSTQSITRDDWSSSTNGEDPMGTGELDGERTESASLITDAPMGRTQSAVTVSQTDMPDIPHSLNVANQDNASMSQFDQGRSVLSPAAALRQPQASPEATPLELSGTPVQTTTTTISALAGMALSVSYIETGTDQSSQPSPNKATITAGAQTPAESIAEAPAMNATAAAMTSRQQNSVPATAVDQTLAVLRVTMPFSMTLHRDAESIRLASGQTELDIARLRFLLKACETEDQDALLLHQIYVAHYLNMPPPWATYPSNHVPDKAFEILSYILGPNGSLTQRLERYLLDFPAPYSNLYHPLLERHVQRMIATLSLLANDWEKSINDCASRGFPYSPAEVHQTFRLASHGLSQVIFTAMLHRLGPMVDRTAAIRLFEQFRPSNSSLAQWRQSFTQTMRTDSLVPRDGRSASSNTLGVARTSPLQTPPLNPPAPHMQNYQNPVDITTRTNPSHSPPDSQSGGTTTLRAGPGVWRNQQSAPPGSHNQQAMVQPQDYAQRTEFRGPQFPGPQQQQHQFQALPAADIQQRHPQPLNGSVQQGTAGPQFGMFQVVNRPQPPARLPSQTVPCNRQQWTPANQPQAPAVQKTPLLPAPGWQMPQAVHPRPDRVALHQAHLRSPLAQIVDLNGKPDNDLRLYQVTAKLDVAPHRLDPAEYYFPLEFDVSPADISHKLVCTPPHQPALTMASNLFRPGALRWRLKCIARPHSDQSEPMEIDFCGSPSSWPEHIFISFNQVDDVVPRRKTHYGRDLTSDLTNAIIGGKNQLRVSFDATSSDKRFQKSYWLGVERVELVSHEDIIKTLKTIPRDEALTRILKSMKGGAFTPLSTSMDPSSAPIDPNNSTKSTNSISTSASAPIATDDDSDGDLIITNPTLSIDVTDPFTATLWTTPVRTVSCRHRECFDLETFLSSRPRSQPSGPADADDWRCPHCQRDARPFQLVRDGFLVSVREELVRQGKEHVKSVELKEDGSWVPREEGEGAGKKGENEGMDGGETPTTEGGGGVNGQGGEHAPASGRQSRAASSTADVVMILD